MQEMLKKLTNPNKKGNPQKMKIAFRSILPSGNLRIYGINPNYSTVTVRTKRTERPTRLRSLL